MRSERAETIGYDRPGGEQPVPSRTRPLDLVHLARQTLGDRAIESEVLGLFIQHAVQLRERIVEAASLERRMLAHGLKGSALGIGAFAVAECAAEIEANPDDQPLVRKLHRRIDEVRDFIATINR